MILALKLILIVVVLLAGFHLAGFKSKNKE